MPQAITEDEDFKDDLDDLDGEAAEVDRGTPRPTITLRGQGGTMWTMDLPLSEHMQEQLAKGALVPVTMDGSPLVGSPA